MSDGGGENISKYWKDFYAKRPDLLPIRSNDEALAHWQAAHGGIPVPENVRNGLTNVKSQLRTADKGKKKRGRPRKNAAPAAAPVARVVKAPAKLLEAIEDQIDVCLGIVGGLKDLEKITHALKHARRLTILHMGS